MNKIATAEELQVELHMLLAMTEEPEPSRAKLASALRDLSVRVAGHNLIRDLVMKDQYRNLAKLTDNAGGIVDTLEKWVEAHPSVPRSKEETIELNGMVRRLRYFAKEMLNLIDFSEGADQRSLAEYFSEYRPGEGGDAKFYESFDKFHEAVGQTQNLKNCLSDLRTKWYSLWFDAKDSPDVILDKASDVMGEMATCRTIYRQFRAPMLEVLKAVEKSPEFRRIG